MKKKIAVIGAGSWGLGLATVLHHNGHEARLYSNMPAQIEEINTKHTSEHFLPGVALPEDLKGYTNLADALDGVSVVLFVVPTSAMR